MRFRDSRRAPKPSTKTTVRNTMHSRTTDVADTVDTTTGTLGTVVLTPTDVCNQLTQMLAGTTFARPVSIRGELSNVKPNYARNWVFFELKDENAKKLKCVVWQYTNMVRDETVRAGMVDGAQVVVTGFIEFDNKFGSNFQCRVRRVAMASDEVGLHVRQLAEWRAALSAEGCFDACHKRHIPEFATNIAVVTADGAAAFQDVLSTWSADHVPVRYKLYPCTVQGAQCVRSVVAQLEAISDTVQDAEDGTPPSDGFVPDVVLVTRGGGSREDLWQFNQPALVRAIHTLRTTGGLPPLVCAIGHEPDHPLLDDVVDRSHITPTDAARALAAPLADLRRVMTDQRRGLRHRMHQALTTHTTRFDRLQERVREAAPYRHVAHSTHRAHGRMRAKITAALQARTDRWTTLHHAITSATPWRSLMAHPNLALMQTDAGEDADTDTFVSGKRGTVVLVTGTRTVKLHYRVGV